MWEWGKAGSSAEKELKGFKKVFLEPGESRSVNIPFDDMTFRFWDTNRGQWETEGGIYKILVGASVSDIRLSGEIFINGTEDVSDYKREEGREIPGEKEGLRTQKRRDLDKNAPSAKCGTPNPLWQEASASCWSG